MGLVKMQAPVSPPCTSFKLETWTNLNLDSANVQIQSLSQSHKGSPRNVGQPVNSLQILGIHYKDSLPQVDSKIDESCSELITHSNTKDSGSCNVTTFSSASDESPIASSLQAPTNSKSNMGYSEADPCDMDAKRLKRKWIDINLIEALQTIPESFGKVPMVHVNCKINDHVIKAVVDTGSQVSILSLAFVHDCSLSSFIDRTCSPARAVGCGSAPFIGCIKPIHFQIGDEVPLSTTAYVLQDWPYKLVIGLDVLRKYRGVLDFQRNILKLTAIGSGKEIKMESMYHVRVGDRVDFLRPLSESSEDDNESMDEKCLKLDKLEKKEMDAEEESEQEAEIDKHEVDDFELPAKKLKLE